MRPAARGERIAAWVVLGVTLAYALTVHTLWFHRAHAIHGDLAYHRGVAYSMVGGNLDGEGPITGLISYFGGLFPMVLGAGAHLVGVSFDTFVSVVSWPATLMLPLALWFLGRQIWDGPLPPALLALLGTVTGPIGDDPAARWVRSVLPSGANFWPIFPRDVGLVLVIVAVALALRPLRTWTTVAIGAIAAVALCVQVQFGVYAVVAAGGALLWQHTRGLGRDGLRRVAQQGALMVVVAVALSAWWWWPRLQAYRESGGLLLKSFPGNTDPPATLFGLIGAFGLLGILGVIGLVLGFRSGSARERLFVCWLAVFLPVAAIGLVVGDSGVLTGRRVLFLMSIPIAVCATVAVVRLLRVVDLRIALPILVVLVALPGFGEAHWISDRVDAAWAPAEPPSPFAASLWQPTLDALRARTEAGDTPTVVAPDNDAEYIWETTGAQPTSLWLPGWVKLGFRLEPLTGTGYLPRVRAAQTAFSSGAAGLCRLARRSHADRVVLRRSGDAVGLYDVRPSARWRVDPADRSTRTIHRRIRPGVIYLDVNDTELVSMGPGASLPLAWDAPDVRFVDLDFAPRADQAAVPPVRLEAAGVTGPPEIIPIGPGRVRARFRTPQGITRDARIVADGKMTVERATGYVPAPGLLARAGATGDAPVAFTRAEICAPVT